MVDLAASQRQTNYLTQLEFNKDLTQSLFAKARRVGTKDHELLPPGDLKGGNEH